MEKKRRKNNQVRNLENFKCNAEVLAVHSRELSLFGIAGFFQDLGLKTMIFLFLKKTYKNNITSLP